MTARDAICWYPMRVTYGRQERVKEFLDHMKVEAFMPMTTRFLQDGRRVKKKRVPMISNLIFIHSSFNKITALKHEEPDAEPLRYMTHRSRVDADAPTEIIVVPDKQMDSFMRVCNGPDDQFTYLQPDELKGKPGSKVTIISGPFTGVTGVIKRIHGTKRVTVEIEGVGGVCINFTPKNFMIEIK